MSLYNDWAFRLMDLQRYLDFLQRMRLGSAQAYRYPQHGLIQDLRMGGKSVSEIAKATGISKRKLLKHWRHR